MEAIASEAGVSKLTLYSHFKDKEALFCAAVKATCETRLPRRLFQVEADCDIEKLLLARSPGIIGAITGRAIYEGTLDVAEAQSFCDNFKG
mgnify:CR=1 FL=1